MLKLSKNDLFNNSYYYNMNFLVESDIVFNGLNKLIFEYLNFRPFLKKLLDITSEIKNSVNGYLRIDLSYFTSYVINDVCEKWIIGGSNRYDFKRQHLIDIRYKRDVKLKVKDNRYNFGYNFGLNMCYIDY